MKHDHDPPRLADAADELLVRRAIGAARRDLPSDERMRRLSMSLLGKLGGGGSGGAPPDAGASAGSAGTAGTTAAGSTAGAFAVKATGIVVAMAVAGAAWHAFRRPTPVSEPMAPVATVGPAPTEVAATPPPTAPDPSPEGSATVPTYSVDSLPTIEPKASARPATSTEAPGEPEISLLQRAQDTLSTDPGRALELCTTHARSYPRSGFAQEREVIAIDALLRLGRRSEAEARADRFAQAYPSSGHRRRIDSLLGR